MGESVVESRPRAKEATYVLKVSNVGTDDSGDYKCILGDMEEIATVVVERESPKYQNDYSFTLKFTFYSLV